MDDGAAEAAAPEADSSPYKPKAPLTGRNVWRRVGDSNPRYRFTRYFRLAGEPIRPLWQLSEPSKVPLLALFHKASC
jgi:hypothetical protein